MSQTHPNAYRMEAHEKRQLAIRLNGEAQALEETADQLEGKNVADKPAVIQTDQPEEPPMTKKQKKFFTRQRSLYNGYTGD